MNQGQFPIQPRVATNSMQPPGGSFPAGYWTSIVSNQNASSNLTLNREVIMPMSIWTPQRVFALGFHISTVGSDSAVVHVGLRGVMNDGWPGPLLSSGFVDGTSATGIGTRWVRQEIDLQPGRYCVCVMGTGWVTTAVGVRGPNVGAGDPNSYTYDLPRIGPMPLPISTALPAAANLGHMLVSRTITDASLTAGAVRDWVINTAAFPAMYVQGAAL